jgi:hypothetical protein
LTGNSLVEVLAHNPLTRQSSPLVPGQQSLPNDTLAPPIFHRISGHFARVWHLSILTPTSSSNPSIQTFCTLVIQCGRLLYTCPHHSSVTNSEAIDSRELLHTQSFLWPIMCVWRHSLPGLIQRLLYNAKNEGWSKRND